MPVPARRSRSRSLTAAGAGLTVLPLLASCGITEAAAGPSLQVYSARTYGAEQAYSRFEEETGIEVEFLNGKDAELRERLQAEGEDSRADVYLTTDVANLGLAAEQGLLQPVDSPELEQAVPEHLRDPQDQWFGLSQRARAIIYDEDQVSPDELSTYEALGDPKWQGEVCLRTSTSPYTQSLVAGMIANEGEERTREIVEGWVDNDAQIMANDVEIVRTVGAGGCKLGITNHYYVMRELAENPDLGVGVFFPNQETTGTHVNISGAGIPAHADDVPEAEQFLEWLATTGQSQFVDGNFEYPVNPSVEPVEQLRGLGEFRADELNVGELARYNADASQLLTDAGYR
jgi:iron(III) transport system substrate-binding protein